MKAMREVIYQDLPWLWKWWRREFDLRARDEQPARLFKEQSTGKIRGEMPGQFARFCLVGMSNAVIDFSVLNAALFAFPTHSNVLLLAYNTVAVVLAATNSFIWNRRFTFRVRGPLQVGEVVRFAVVPAVPAATTAKRTTSPTWSGPRTRKVKRRFQMKLFVAARTTATVL
jgi:hypothetical protein